jgi:hypothetical protein
VSSSPLQGEPGFYAVPSVDGTTDTVTWWDGLDRRWVEMTGAVPVPADMHPSDAVGRRVDDWSRPELAADPFREDQAPTESDAPADVAELVKRLEAIELRLTKLEGRTS